MSDPTRLAWFSVASVFVFAAFVLGAVVSSKRADAEVESMRKVLISDYADDRMKCRLGRVEKPDGWPTWTVECEGHLVEDGDYLICVCPEPLKAMNDAEVTDAR